MKHRRLRLAGFCGAVLSLATPTAAQTAVPPTQSLPVLRSTTHLIQVNVIALDKSGKPVPDLKAADFVLTDDGKPQKISIFALEKSEAATTEGSLPSNTFSNRWEDRAGASPSVTVILMDGVNTALPDQAYAPQRVLDFFKRMGPRTASRFTRSVTGTD